MGSQSAFNRLPRHVRSIDAGAFLPVTGAHSFGRAARTSSSYSTEYAQRDVVTSKTSSRMRDDLQPCRDSTRRAPTRCAITWLEIHRVQKAPVRSYMSGEFAELIGHSGMQHGPHRQLSMNFISAITSSSLT